MNPFPPKAFPEADSTKLKAMVTESRVRVTKC